MIDGRQEFVWSDTRHLSTEVLVGGDPMVDANRLRVLQDRIPGSHCEFLSFSAHFATEYATRLETLTRVVRGVSPIARDVEPGAWIMGRVKGLQSTWHKIRRSCPERVRDSIGVRILLSRTSDCYRLLDGIRSTFEIVPGSDDDYIRSPKPNGYQSLHTTIVGPSGQGVEIQLRTHWMHKLAENGTAAHWLYKMQSSLAEPHSAGEVSGRALSVQCRSHKILPWTCPNYPGRGVREQGVELTRHAGVWSLPTS